MRRIRIISIPQGEAPEWVRKAWIGLEIPIIKEEPQGAQSSEVLSGKFCTRGGYWVQRDMALNLLGRENPEALYWWLRHYRQKEDDPWADRLLLFDTNCCEVIE